MAVTFSNVLVGDDGSVHAAIARRWADAVVEVVGGEISSVSIGRDHDGSPANGVLQRARHMGADLIVVGRRGGGGFHDLQLGGTAHQIAEHATVPTAVVPHPADGIRSSWSFSRMAVGVDGSPASSLASTWTATLAAAASAHVWAVHALGLPIPQADDMASTQAGQDVSAMIEPEWCAPFRDAGVPYEPLLIPGGPAAVLLEAVRSLSIDLLVVGRRGSAAVSPLAMGSVAHRAIAFSPCPTVVIPAIEPNSR
jgi:nucleotide-binding universal stress UspA family protein